MRRVSKQQFIRYTSKYLKDLPIIVTHRGIDNLLIRDVEESDYECKAVSPDVIPKTDDNHW